MQEGSPGCDVYISIHPIRQAKFATIRRKVNYEIQTITSLQPGPSSGGGWK
ncbi:hypothetical protein YC2023_116354 [Brassica napus]